MKSDAPVRYKDEKTRRITEETFARAERRREEERKAVEEAKKDPANSDKEPFTFEAFAEVYDTSGITGRRPPESITDGEIEDWEYEYYVENPGFKTLQEFADLLRQREREEQG